MSVYGGFANRQLETTYNKALFNTVYLLQLRISKLFKGGKDIAFDVIFLFKRISMISNLEKYWQSFTQDFLLWNSRSLCHRNSVKLWGIFPSTWAFLSEQRMTSSKRATHLKLHHKSRRWLLCSEARTSWKWSMRIMAPTQMKVTRNPTWKSI